MGRDYQIIFDHDSPLELTNLGICNNQMMIIAIKDGQHPVEEADTLVHEIFHAVWYCMSIAMTGAGEEEIVRRLSSGFTSVLMDNPQLLKYLTAIQNPPKLEL
jgi:hypothetical protein